MPLCGRCLKRPPPYTTIVAPFLYQPPIDHLIGQLKFAGQLRMAPLFANLMHDAIKQLPDTDALVPVPLHRWRLLRRGFNQSALMARAISRSSGLPIFDAATRRVGGPALHGMHATQRRRAIRDVFTLRQSVAGMRLTLVDDVVTTGATVGELSRLLLRAGAQRVSVLCLARTPNH